MASSTGREGVHYCGLIAERNNWLFREQPVNDIGIDAHMELTEPTANQNNFSHYKSSLGQVGLKSKKMSVSYSETSTKGNTTIGLRIPYLVL